ATRFQISEATLNRQLLGLNQLLEEFGLVIQNGRLRGSELQIRYLAFRLLQEISLPADVLNLQQQAAFVDFQTALQGLTQKDL
ncbi:helix-turn-helix domain-containing protein, partial [Streptococcus danieliae]|nr:helix-turn-helix domain-containing protein [Streptococcus danieliae]